MSRPVGLFAPLDQGVREDGQTCGDPRGVALAQHGGDVLGGQWGEQRVCEIVGVRAGARLGQQDRQVAVPETIGADPISGSWAGCLGDAQQIEVFEKVAGVGIQDWVEAGLPVESLTTAS
ncbi:hypothetical protein ACQP2K_09960 [Microbispora siamensis]